MKKLHSAVALALAVATGFWANPAPAQPTTAPASPKAAAPVPAGLTPEQAAILNNLPPGSRVDIEVTKSGGGSTKVTERGHSVGAGATAEGDKLSENFNGSAPGVNVGGNTATGGGASRTGKADAFLPPESPWANPLFWIGLVMVGGGGFLTFKLPTARKTGIGVAVAGGACMATAFYPALLLWGVAAALLIVFGPTIHAKLQEHNLDGMFSREFEQNLARHEALRALLAALYDKAVPEDARKAVLDRLAEHGEPNDLETIRKIRVDDRLGESTV